MQQEVVLDLPYAEAWQHVKHTLLAEDYTLYTRDKRGVFVAYTGGGKFLGVSFPASGAIRWNLEPSTMCADEGFHRGHRNRYMAPRLPRIPIGMTAPPRTMRTFSTSWRRCKGMCKKP